MLAPATEHVSRKFANGISKFLIILKSFFEVFTELLDGLLSAIVFECVWVSEPATFTDWSLSHVPTVRTTSCVDVCLVGLAMAYACLWVIIAV
jgi:hypothetical protein